MRLPGLGVPVDPLTGYPLSQVVLGRLAKLKDVVWTLRLALHELDGTTEGSQPGNRCMAMAFTKLDEVAMWAAEAVLERPGGR